MRWGLIARNVAKLVKPPRANRAEVQPLDPHQARQLLHTVQGHRLEALFTVALAIGLRPGEALGLQWQDVDLEAGTLSVRKALQRARQWQTAIGRGQIGDESPPHHTSAGRA